MPQRFFAHSGKCDNKGDWQLLAIHLRAVASGARQRAQDAYPNAASLHSAAYIAGLLHDLGKYRDEFQQYLCGVLKKGDPRTYHKQARRKLLL
jgi:CRISPR-associated endonuclease/helicase Cas3